MKNTRTKNIKPKHSNIPNVNLTGYPSDIVEAVANFAKKHGVRIKIDGLPFGDHKESSRIVKDKFDE